MTQRTWDVCNGSSLQLSIHQLGDNEVSRKGQESEITRWQEKTFKGNSYAWYLEFSNRGVYTCIKICQIVYSPWGCKVSDAESTHTHTHTHTINMRNTLYTDCLIGI